MSINIYHSRRDKFRECKYWLRNEDETTNLNEWVLFKVPSGIFYAKESNPLVNQNNKINDSILIDKDTITLETSDNVDDISRGCVVLYLGHSWIVDDVQRSIINKESQFSANEIIAETYIRIRR